MPVIQCGADHVEDAARLFDLYRQFYDYPGDAGQCLAFIGENLQQQRSRIYLALDDSGAVVGFCQLYPAWCSLAMRPYFYLSDLYVVPDARQHGHARRLLDHVASELALKGAQRLTLETATSNHSAQRLYESQGYERDPVFITYHRQLDQAQRHA